MKPARILALLIGTLVLSAPGALVAGGFNNPDMGPRRNAMFAVTAMPDDTTAIMHNPAGLADQRGHRLYLSGMAAMLNLEAEVMCEPWMESYDHFGECSDREYSRPFTPERTFGVSPFFGFSVDLDPIVDNLVVGGALYAPNFLGAFMSDNKLARFYGIENLFLTVLGTGAVSYRLNDYVSVGGGVSYMYVLFQSWRRMDLGGLTEGVLQQEGDIKLDGRDHTQQFHLGVLVNPAPWISFGLGWDTETRLRVKGDVAIAFVDDDLADPVQDPFVELRHETELVVPHKLKAGVNVRPNDWLEIGIDYFFWRYSVFQEQTTHVIVPEGTEGFGSVLADVWDPSSPRHMTDSHNLCGGVRIAIPHAPFPLWVMTGAQYDWSPGNDKYFSLDSPYADIYGMSLGFDSQPVPWLKVGAAWIHNRFSAIDIKESEAVPPANIRASIHNNQLQLALQAIF